MSFRRGTRRNLIRYAWRTYMAEMQGVEDFSLSLEMTKEW
jgi:hypothetical protein